MLTSTDRRLVSTITSGAQNIERGARQRSPVQTGNLRAAWGSEIETSHAQIEALIGNEAHYSPHVEFGTQHMDAQPMLRPALDDELRNILREIRMTVIKVAELEGGR